MMLNQRLYDVKSEGQKKEEQPQPDTNRKAKKKRIETKKNRRRGSNLGFWV